VLDGDGTDAFLARAGRAFVRVTVTRAGGAGTVTGSGLLLGDRLVVTNRHWLDDPAGEHGLAEPARVRVGTEAGPSTVRRIGLPDSPHLDVAVLHLDEPVAPSPLRLGHGELVRIGDRVWTPGPAGDGPPALLDGVVDGFESFPEQGLRLFRTGLRIGPAGSGGPLLNALGEVVGVLTVGRESGAATFALTVDRLRPLLDTDAPTW
jgi:S1-C subfamily serine protease